MSELYKKKCIACDGSTPPFDLAEIHKYLKKVDGWHVKHDDKKNYFLIKEFKFNNFLESQNFVNSVGVIAEKEGHHPDTASGPERALYSASSGVRACRQEDRAGRDCEPAPRGRLAAQREGWG